MAEKEYIERNNVISHKRPFTEFDEGGWSCKVQAVAVEDIQNIPAADVAPVVHCKDCEYNNECSVQDFGEMHKNDFCSHGKRKELDNG